MALTETAIQLANTHFASPIGLTALASLIPLIIFYLVKPKPEEQIMPSMMFFMEKKKSGKVSQAIQSLVRNLLLLLHILLVIGLAAAIAQPMVEGLERPEETVVIFDRSASMENDLSNAKQFVKSNLGRENTLVLVDSSVSVPMEEASASQIRSYINGLKTRDVETDIISGLETIQDYDGRAVIASDLSHTVSSQEATESVERLKNNREVTIMETKKDNKWGIIEVNPKRGNSTVEIKNFQQKPDSITVDTGKREREVEIDGEEARPLNVETERGTSIISLEKDPVEADNKAFITIPGKETHDITYIADEENRYFREAVNVNPNAEYEYKRPPIEDSLDADIYVVGETDRILEGNAREIQSQVRDGRSLVLFGQKGIREKGFSESPAKLDNPVNKTVEIHEPIRASIGNTKIHEATKVNGRSVSTPKNAMLRKDLGEGEIFLYNIQDKDFRFDFLYPVFWKKLFEDVTETPTVGEFNRETGATLNASGLQNPEGEELEGEITAYEAGFYNSSSETYAINMESEPESDSEPLKVEGRENLEQDSKKNVQNLGAALLAIIALLELLYLVWIGEV